MSDYFEDVISDSIYTVDDNNEEVLTEAYYSNTVDYMKAVNYRVDLPRGNRPGYGNICFLYSNSINDSIEIMKSRRNLSSRNFYKFYYIPSRYKGKIGPAPYRAVITKERRNLYSKVAATAKPVKGYPLMELTSKEDRNIYFDLSKYIEIFTEICEKRKFIPALRIRYYWAYFNSILFGAKPAGYANKYIAVNLKQFPLYENWKENLNNPLYLIYYTAYKYINLLEGMDIDFLFYTDKKFLKINPSQLHKGDAQKLKILMHQMYSSIPSTKDAVVLIGDPKPGGEMDSSSSKDKVYSTKDVVDKITDAKVIDKKEITTAAVNKYTSIAEVNHTEVLNFSDSKDIKDNKETIGVEADDKKDLKIISSVRKKVAEVEDEVDAINDSRDEDNQLEGEELADFVDQRTEDKINEDEELISAIYDKATRSVVPKEPVMSARDKELKAKQKDLKMKNMTIKDIEKIKSTHMPIDTKDISNKTVTMNTQVNTIKFNNFEKTYNEKVMPKDIINSVLALNDKPIPMYLYKDVKIEDTSDELNYKDTYTFYLEDANRKRHTIKVDIPKFIDDKFLYINGSKKHIKHQSLLLPVVKIKNDTVLVGTSYNKMTITRKDTKSLGSIEKLEKFLAKNDEAKKYFKFGNRYKANAAWITTVEYDELAKILVNFSKGKCKIFFDQNDAKKYAESHNITVDKSQLFIGTDYMGANVFINIDDQLTKDGKRIIDIITEALPEEMQAEYNKIKLPRSLMYANVKIMKKDIPIGTIMCFWEGFSTVLKKLGVEYRLAPNPRDVKPNEAYIRFKDCYVIYKDNITSSLILNGLRVIKTEDYELSTMDTMEPYMEYFVKKYGRSNVTNAFMNFYDFTIDPITEEILNDLNLPTNLNELLIYAVSLLADSQYVTELDTSLQRVRSHEIIPAILYDTLAKSYNNYRISNGKKQFSIPQDSVLKSVLGLPTVEEYSTLNPILELQTTHAVTNRGFRGVNDLRSYKYEKRSFNPSMTGIMSPGASPDANVGITKTLTLEPRVTSMRGYLTPCRENDSKDLESVNVFGPGELSVTLGATIDDPTRIG